MYFVVAFRAQANAAYSKQVWKRVWILEVWSENGCGKLHFLVWNKGQDLENRAAHPATKNYLEYPPGGGGGWKSEVEKVKIEKRARHNAHHFTAYDLISSLAMSSSWYTVAFKLWLFYPHTN